MRLDRINEREHHDFHIKTQQGSLHASVSRGAEPDFVLLHGFPDNSKIYHPLMQRLLKRGHGSVAFDFLGFGDSDKPDSVHYSFAQQRADVNEVIDGLGLKRIIVVGHDAGGAAAVNLALDRPDRVAAVVLINAFYSRSPGLRMPEFIELFATPSLRTISAAFLKDPGKLGWLLNLQRKQMQLGLSEAQRTVYQNFLAPIIDENFRQIPSAANAFAQMTANLEAELSSNTARLTDLRRLEVPLHCIWGTKDAYLHISTAEFLCAQSRNSTVHRLEAGHWPQIDDVETVATILTSFLAVKASK